ISAEAPICVCTPRTSLILTIQLLRLLSIIRSRKPPSVLCWLSVHELPKVNRCQYLGPCRVGAFHPPALTCGLCNAHRVEDLCSSGLLSIVPLFCNDSHNGMEARMTRVVTFIDPIYLEL